MARVAHLFRVLKHDTAEIALICGISEAHVYNALAAYRERAVSP